MNRSLKCIMTVILIASVLCGALAPAVSAGVVVQTTTPSGLKPSSCYSAPKYPEPVFTFQPSGSSSGVVHWGPLGPLFDGPPYSVEFHDLTPAPVTGQTIASRFWNFGDGATSTEKDPVHTYAGPGDYTALLSVTTICGSQYTKKIPFSVTTYCTQPDPSFTVDVLEGTAPLTVHVTDTSRQTFAGVTTWKYYYSMDGSSTVRHERNPVYTFSTPGTYTITQAVTKSCTEPAGSTTEKPSVFAVIIKVNPSPYSAVPGGRISQTTTTMTFVAPVYTATTAPALQEPASANTPALPAVASASGPPPQGSTGAAAAPISTGTGTLSVVTDPPGAALFIDDVTWGASPASIPNLAAGSHTLRLEKAGYQTMSVPIIISDGKTAEYVLNLIPDNAGGNRAAPLGAAAAVIAFACAGLFILMRKEDR